MLHQLPASFHVVFFESRRLPEKTPRLWPRLDDLLHPVIPDNVIPQGCISHSDGIGRPALRTAEKGVFDLTVPERFRLWVDLRFALITDDLHNSNPFFMHIAFLFCI